MQNAISKRVPTIFVRHEDLTTNPDASIKTYMKLITGLSDLTGTNAERRVNEVISMGLGATQTYALKSSTLDPNSRAKLFN